MKKFLLLTTCISALSINFAADTFSWSHSKTELTTKVAEIKQAALSIPFCFDDDETEIINALEDAMKEKDPEAAKSKLAHIFCNVVGKDGSDRILSKDISVTKTKNTIVESDPKSCPISRRTYSDLKIAVRYKHAELLNQTNIRVIGEPRFPVEHNIVENTLFTFFSIGLYQAVHDYKANIDYVTLSHQVETYQDVETKIHSLSKMRSLFLELFSLVSTQIQQRNETRRRANEKAEADQKAAEKKRQADARAEQARREAARQKEMEGLDAKALTQLGHSYEAGTNGKIKDLRYAFTVFKTVVDMEGGRNYQKGEACFQVGRYLLLGLGGQTKNPTEAAKYFQQTYSNGHTHPTNTDPTTQLAWNSATKAQSEAARLRKIENDRRLVEKQGLNAQQLRELGMCYLSGKTSTSKWHQREQSYAEILLLEAYEKGDGESALLLAQAEFYGGRGRWTSYYGLSDVLENGDARKAQSPDYSREKFQAYCQEAYRWGVKDFNDPRFVKFNAAYIEATKDQRRVDERTGLNGDQLNALACHYFNSTDKTIADKAYGVELFKLAHEAGSAVGSQNYERAFLYGWGGIKIDIQKAYKLFQDSYSRGYRLETTASEKLKEHWNKATKELQAKADEAKRLAELEAARKKEISDCGGDGAKLNKLGYQYINGLDGKTKDEAHAVTLFKLSHEAGNMVGSYNLGLAALYGWGGTPTSKTEAYRLFGEAYKRGYRIEATASEDFKKDWNSATKALQEAERAEKERLEIEATIRRQAEETARLEAVRIAAEKERVAIVEKQKAEEMVESERSGRDVEYKQEQKERHSLEDEFRKAVERVKKAEAERKAAEAKQQAEEKAKQREQELIECNEDVKKLQALAESYEKGTNGKVRDIKHSVEVYKQAADLGDSKVAFMVVNLCFHHSNLNAMTTAKEYARKAFKLGQRNCWGQTEGFGKFFHDNTKDLQEEENERLERITQEKGEEQERLRIDEIFRATTEAVRKVAKTKPQRVNCNDVVTNTHTMVEGGHFVSNGVSELEPLYEEMTLYPKDVIKGTLDTGVFELDVQRKKEETVSTGTVSYVATSGASSIPVPTAGASIKTEEERASPSEGRSVASVPLLGAQNQHEMTLEADASIEDLDVKAWVDEVHYADTFGQAEKRPLKAFVNEGRAVRGTPTHYEDNASLMDEGVIPGAEHTATNAEPLETTLQDLSISREADDVSQLFSSISTLGWETAEFKPLLATTDSPLAFKAGVRMLCNYRIKPTDTHFETHHTVHELIIQKGSLKNNWLESLETYVQETYLKKNENARDANAFFNELLASNPDKHVYIENELRPKVLGILEKYESCIEGSATKISKWDQTMITQWAKAYRKLDSKTQKEKIVELMAVIYQSVEIVYQYSPRVTQFAAVLATLKNKDEPGRFLQIATGEGKTVITAMTAAVLALWGEKVDIASSSEELCHRDAATDSKQAAFYRLLTLDCADVAIYDTGKIVKGYEAPIVYGTIHSFSGHVLNQTFLGQKRRGDRPFNVLLADEVDSLTIDQIDSFTQLSQPVCGSESLLTLLALIHQQLDALIELPFSEDQIKEQLLTWSEALLRDPKQKALQSKGGQPLEIVITDQLKAFVRYQLPMWIESAISARINYKKERDHLVHTNGHIRPIDYQHTGVVHLNQVYSDGIHQYLQFKENSYVTPETVIGSFMSPLTYLGLYNKRVYGVTGTMGNKVARKFMSSVYSVDFMEIPTFKPKQFFEYTPNIQESQSDWTQSIVNSVEDETRRGRAVLVLCETKGQLEALANILEQKIEDKTKLVVYSRNDEKKEDHPEGEQKDNHDKFPEMVNEGMVILATNLAGRGTDLIISKEVEEKGGLHVCLTFLPMNERVEAQNFGRAARQGQRGSGQLVVCARHSGFIENGSSDTIEAIRGRRQTTQKERLDAVVAYNIPEGKFQDNSFAQAQTLMSKLRPGKYFDEGERLTLTEAKLDQLSQLWGLQYHLIRTYKQRIYTDQLRQLRRTASDKHLKVKDVYDDRPNQLIAMVAEEAGVPYKMLKHKLLTYIWTKAHHNEATFAEIVGDYVQPSDVFFRACSSILNQSIVIITQNSDTQVYRQAGEGVIVLGELTGGKDAPSTTSLEKEWVIHDVLDDGNCVFHALGHQMRLYKHALANEETPFTAKPEDIPLDDRALYVVGAMLSRDDYKHEEHALHIRLRRKLSKGIASKVGDSEGYDAIGRFVNEFDCVVGVANESELRLGYTYYYRDDKGEIRTITPDMNDYNLPEHKRIYRLVAHHIEGYDHPHFKSVVQDPFMALEAAVLPNVYDVIPSYRGVNETPLRIGAPSTLLKRYATLYWDKRDEASWVKEMVKGSQPAPTSITMDGSAELVDNLKEKLEEEYQTEVAAYYERNLEGERSYVDRVIQSFITTSTALFNDKPNGGIILSAPMLIQVMDQLLPSEWVDRLTQVMGAEPQYRHAAYYAHACKLVKGAGTKYKERAVTALKKVELHLGQINAPWFAIQSVLRPEPNTPLSKQVGGRFSFIQRILESVEQNITQINTCQSDHSLEVKVKGFDFEQLGVLTEDVMACRMNGVAALMELEQIPPKPTFGELFGLAVIGVLQGVAGVALTMCGCVNVGISLISESVSDLWLAIDSAIHDKAVDWAGYLKSKAISIMMAVGSAAWSALSEGAKAAQEAAKAAAEGVKGAATNVQKSFGERFSKSFLGEASKTVRDQATGLLKSVPLTGGELVWKAAIGAGKALTSQVVGMGVAKIRHGMIDSFQKKIETFARDRMTILFENPGFKAEVSQIYRFDVATRSHWKMETRVRQQMDEWQKKNNRELINLLKTVASTLSRSDARSTNLGTALVGAGAEFGVGMYNITVANEFMGHYIEALKRWVHECALDIMEITGVTKELLNVKETIATEWVEGLKKAGVIMGKTPYQLQRTPAGDGVNPNREEALKGLLEVTCAVLSAGKETPMSERDVRAHPLYQFGSRMIEVAHGDENHLMGAASRSWEKHLTGSMKGELHVGIGTQVNALTQSAMMSGAGAFIDACGEKYNDHRITTLEKKEASGIALTQDEVQEIQDRKGAKYEQLVRDEKGMFGLSDEEKARLDQYRKDDSAGRAALQAAHVKAEFESPYSAKAAEEAKRNLLKKAFGKFEAENPNFVRDELAKEAVRQQQREAALYAVDETRPKPEPAGAGTLPATASGKALTPSMVETALDQVKSRKSYHEIEKQNPFLNAGGLADKCKEEGARLREGEYRHLMDRCVAEGATLDADTWTYLQGQRSRENWDKSYIYCETTNGLIAVPVDRLEQSRPHQLGQALDDIAEAYDGSKLQSGVRTISDGIGTVFHEFGKALCMPTDVDSADELRLFGKMYDETPGPMQYVGEKLHQGAQKGFEFAGASRHSAEILATATLDVVNIATAATGAKAALRPVATSAGAALKTTLQHGVDVAKRVEFKVQTGTMSANGLGGVDIRLRPKVEAPTVAASKATGAAAEWTQPMRVAPKVEFTAPSAGMRAPVSHYESVVRPTVPVHVDTVPSHPVRPMVAEPVITHNASAATAPNVRPILEPVTEAGAGKTTALAIESVASGAKGTHSTPAGASVSVITSTPEALVKTSLSKAELTSLFPNGLFENSHPLKATRWKSAGLTVEEGQSVLNTAIKVKEGSYINFTQNGELVRFAGKRLIEVNGTQIDILHAFKVDLKELSARNLDDIQSALKAAGLMDGKGKLLRAKVNERLGK